MSWRRRIARWTRRIYRRLRNHVSRWLRGRLFAPCAVPLTSTRLRRLLLWCLSGLASALVLFWPCLCLSLSLVLRLLQRYLALPLRLLTLLLCLSLSLGLLWLLRICLTTIFAASPSSSSGCIAAVLRSARGSEIAGQPRRRLGHS